MEYILIDTNCWIDILKDGNDSNLSTIEYWINSENAILLIPEQLSKEWENQKKVQSSVLTI
jgi:predicted nucleic acid-binding protein